MSYKIELTETFKNEAKNLLKNILHYAQKS